jgi:hypothetical protein
MRIEGLGDWARSQAAGVLQGAGLNGSDKASGRARFPGILTPPTYHLSSAPLIPATDQAAILHSTCLNDGAHGAALRPLDPD